MKTGYPLGIVQILNNISKLKQLSTNQKVSKQTAKKILLDGTFVNFMCVYKYPVRSQ